MINKFVRIFFIIVFSLGIFSGSFLGSNKAVLAQQVGASLNASSDSCASINVSWSCSNVLDYPDGGATMYGYGLGNYPGGNVGVYQGGGGQTIGDVPAGSYEYTLQCYNEANNRANKDTVSRSVNVEACPPPTGTIQGYCVDENNNAISGCQVTSNGIVAGGIPYYLNGVPSGSQQVATYAIPGYQFLGYTLDPNHGPVTTSTFSGTWPYVNVPAGGAVNVWWHFGRTVVGQCAATHYNCAAGTLGANADYPTEYHWYCNGKYGGATSPLCVEYKAPTCSSATPDGVTVAGLPNSTSHEVSINGVSGAASNVKGYVWSDVNGQDDLWPTNGVYNAVNQGGGVWKFTIPFSKHPDYGTFSVHTYMENGGYNLMCDTANFTRNGPPPVCGSTHFTCDSGTPSNTSGFANNWSWNCNGANNGGTIACNQAIPIPTGVSSSCNATGTIGTFSWTAPSGFNTFYTRGDNGLPWDENFVGTTKTFTTTPGASYSVWVHTKDTATAGYSNAVYSYFTCPLTPVNGVCSATHYGCTAGTSVNNAEPYTKWTWGCDGLNGGNPANPSCEQLVPTPTAPIISCAVSATSANASWTLPSGYNLSYFRVYDVTIGDYVPSLSIPENVSDTGPATSFAVTPGHTYNTWVHTREANGHASSEVYSGEFTCNNINLTASVASPATATVGTPTTFSATISNSGSITTGGGAFNNIFQFDDDADHNALPSTPNLVTAGPVASNGTANISSAKTFSTSGTWYVRACADLNQSSVGAITESNESDNCSATWTAVTVGCTAGTSGTTCANIPPVANAGPDKATNLPTSTSTPTGTSATDTAPGTISSTVWSQVGSTPSVATITGSATLSPAFSNLSSVGTYTFRLTVTDNSGGTHSDDMLVVVSPNIPPVANAGPDKAITLPVSSSAPTGTSATDTAPGTLSSIVWSQVGATPSVATITGSTTIIPSFSNLSTAGTYTFRLTVTDNSGGTHSDDMLVVVSPASTFVLTVNTAGTGTGTAGPAGVHAAGAVVPLTNIPSENSVFTSWGGDADCANGSVTMNADKTCTATFTLKPVTGTIIPSSSSCEIIAGASACTKTLVWDTQYPTSTSTISSDAATPSPQNTNSGSQVFTIPYNPSGAVFTLTHPGVQNPLATSTINAVCTSGTVWNGLVNGSCVVSNITGTLTSQSDTCTITAGNTNCSINFSWTTVTNSPPIPSPSSVTSDINDLGQSSPDFHVATDLNNGTNVPFTIPYTGPYTGQNLGRKFYLYNNSLVLAEKTVTAVPDTNCTMVNGTCVLNAIPTLNSPTAVTNTTTATLGAKVASLGVPSVLSARGGCFSIGSNPTLTNGATCVTATLSQAIDTLYTMDVTGLTPNTVYHYRGYATNAFGTGYSNDWTFTTLPLPMTGTLLPGPFTSCTQPIALGASSCTVSLTRTVDNEEVVGGSAVTSPTGTPSPSNGDSGTVVFTVPYNALGVNFFLYNNAKKLAETNVSTPCVPDTHWDTNTTTCIVDINTPIVTTPTHVSVTDTSAILGATVTDPGFPATILERGTCFGALPAPTTNCAPEGATILGIFTHSRTGLTPSTAYYYRGYATNASGTGYSTDETFTTQGGAMSGTLIPSATSCIIAQGASSCPVDLSWVVTNPETLLGTEVTSSTPVPDTKITPPVTTGTADVGTKSNVSISYPSRTFYLYNNSKSLAPVDGSGVTVTTSCAPGTVFINNKCDIISDALAVDLKVNGSDGATSDTAVQVVLGAPVTVTWTSTGHNARTCSSSDGISEDGWASSSKPTSGSMGTTAPSTQATNKYSISCTDISGTVNDTVWVKTSVIATDNTDNTTTPNVIYAGNKITINWQCPASSTSSVGVNFNTGGTTFGSLEIIPDATKTYSVTCNEPSGGTPVSGSVEITVKKKAYVQEN